MKERLINYKQNALTGLCSTPCPKNNGCMVGSGACKGCEDHIKDYSGLMIKCNFKGEN